MRVIVAAVLLTAVVGGAAVAQSSTNRPDITGVWVMDTTIAPIHDAELLAMKTAITRSGDTLFLTNDIVDRRATATTHLVYALDGSRTQTTLPNGIVLTHRVSWDGPVLVVVSTTEAAGRALTITDRWYLGTDGKTLWRESLHVMGDQRVTQTLAFVRASPSSSSRDEMVGP